MVRSTVNTQEVPAGVLSAAGQSATVLTAVLAAAGQSATVLTAVLPEYLLAAGSTEYSNYTGGPNRGTYCDWAIYDSTDHSTYCC